MKLEIGNQGAMQVKAAKTTPHKKPSVARGGDLRSRPGNR